MIRSFTRAEGVGRDGLHDDEDAGLSDVGEDGADLEGANDDDELYFD